MSIASISVSVVCNSITFNEAFPMVFFSRLLTRPMSLELVLTRDLQIRLYDVRNRNNTPQSSERSLQRTLHSSHKTRGPHNGRHGIAEPNRARSNHRKTRQSHGRDIHPRQQDHHHIGKRRRYHGGNGPNTFISRHNPFRDTQNEEISRKKSTNGESVPLY